MITIKSITKSFGSLQVLKGIDLQINKGEVVSIVGPSGAGKTTLLQIIGTLDRPDGGEVVVDGVDVGTLSSKKLSDFRNQHLGFIFQFHQLLPEFTALENVMIPAYIAGKKKSEAMQRANELLSFLGLADRANHKPAELSGGEKQRVAVATSLRAVWTRRTRPNYTNCSSICATSSAKPSSLSRTMKSLLSLPTAPFICATAWWSAIWQPNNHQKQRNKTKKRPCKRPLKLASLQICPWITPKRT